jgi:cobalt-zinc-cadmium efflux system outer membrane protein
VARADVLAASRWPNPRVTYNREAVAGVTENMFLVSQGLPITGRRGFEVSAASALVEASARRAEDEIRTARAALRSAYADLVGAQRREEELTKARDRLRELAQVLARREEAGEAAGYDRIRAEREVADIESDWAASRAERARAQAALAGFFADSDDVTTMTAVAPAPARQALPDVATLTARAGIVRGEPAALRQEIDAARFADQAAGRRPVPEPEIVAGTKSSNVLGGDVGSVFSVHASIPSRRCDSRRRRRERPRSSRRCVRRLPAFAPWSWSAARRRIAIAQWQRRAPSASSGSRRSATTRVSAAFSNCWMPSAAVPRRARARPHSMHRCGRPKSNWSS